MRSMSSLLLASLLCLLASPARAEPEEIVHEESGLEFAIPDGWTFDQSDDFLIALSPTGELNIAFAITPQPVKDPTKMPLAFDKGFGEVMKDIQFTGKQHKRQVNGLTQYHTRATGTCDKDVPCNMQLVLVTGAKKHLVIMAIGDFAPHQATLDQLYASIRPAEPSPP